MTKIRKPQWLVLAALLATALIAAACGDDSTTTSEPEPQEAEEPAAEAGNDDPPANKDEESTVEVASVGIAADGFLLGTQAWIADDQGFFAANNIEAKVLNRTGSDGDSGYWIPTRSGWVCWSA